MCVFEQRRSSFHFQTISDIGAQQLDYALAWANDTQRLALAIETWKPSSKVGDPPTGISLWDGRKMISRPSLAISKR